MNILHVLLGGYAWLAVGYNAFKKSIISIINPDPEAQTPAQLKYDAVDYVPAKPLVLFGHHYMSIAGTSPIIASIVGLLWGWGPALLWMCFGVILVGAVHDYFALMISVRNEGKSMGDVIKEQLGDFSGLLSSIVLAFGGILVYAIFLSIISGTLATTPTSVIPTIALIPIAVLCGFMMRYGVNLVTATLIGMLLIIISIYFGIQHPVAASQTFWSYFFLFYTFAAVYSPVWALLQPRDYLNSTVLFFGLILGFIGLIIGHPTIKMPFFRSFVTPERGPLWPMLFATISCGAASGWHSLIAAGTTSKQLNNEKSGFKIAYGAMVGETVMAVLSAALIISAFSYDQYLANGLSSSAISKAFADSLGNAISYLGISPVVGSTIGALALAALTLTTLDSFARTARYVVQEIAGTSFLNKPLWSGLFVTLAGFFLYKFVPFIDLWNGLVLGGLLILVLPFIILIIDNQTQKKPKNFSYYLHLIFPLAFLFPTTMSGLFYLFWKYVKESKYTSVFLVIILVVLAISLLIQTVKKLRLLTQNDLTPSVDAGNQ